MHEVRRMVATLYEIFLNSLFSKTFSFESIIARALNRVPRISRDFEAFLNKKILSKSGFFYVQTLIETFLEVSNKIKQKTKVILLLANTGLRKHVFIR